MLTNCLTISSISVSISISGMAASALAVIVFFYEQAGIMSYRGYPFLSSPGKRLQPV
jgi:hypothetical protein